MIKNINDKRHAARILLRDEGTGKSHAIAKHVNVDDNLFLLTRCKKSNWGNNKVGTTITAFTSLHDMASSLKYAINNTDAKKTINKQGGIEILSDKLPANLRNLTIKVAELFENGHAECYDAKLRSIIVVVNPNQDYIITVYPKDYYKI